MLGELGTHCLRRCILREKRTKKQFTGNKLDDKVQIAEIEPCRTVVAFDTRKPRVMNGIQFQLLEFRQMMEGQFVEMDRARRECESVIQLPGEEECQRSHFVQLQAVRGKVEE